MEKKRGTCMEGEEDVCIFCYEYLTNFFPSCLIYFYYS